MEERKALKEEATRSSDADLFDEYKLKMNMIKMSLPTEEERFYKEKLSTEKITNKKAWKLVVGQSQE